ncbi:MAG: 1-aminocyclopropane-1-carboxylate deaminase/D-cysteine desulfhydrase [Bacteroidetes bacterium]|nr:MAG: 1-aminocyclopropane-1-carboxylate deaminase/D-cysteine desulfhydrase [Bacteroidota bacterium]
MLIEQVFSQIFLEQNVKLYVSRNDLVHPFIQGNKWYKLMPNLAQARLEQKNTLVTFGGAFSNHIFATASAGKEFGFQTIGIIRGEKTLPLNPVLAHAQNCGMKLVYISRSEYRNKKNEDFLEKLKQNFGDIYLVPEGGANELGMKGCMQMVSELADYQYVCCACGTGTMLAGIRAKLPENIKIIGFSALKGNFLEQEITNKLAHINQDKKFTISYDYHFGGYAKKTIILEHFIEQFYTAHHIPLEPIYTGKMMFGIVDLIKKGFFAAESKILAIHSGGIKPLYNF